MCLMLRMVFRKCALLLKLWRNKDSYFWTFFSSVPFLHVNGNSIRRIMKKDMLSLIL